jgi:hypothetical protein
MIIESVKKNEKGKSHEKKYMKSRRECIENPEKSMKL